MAGGKAMGHDRKGPLLVFAPWLLVIGCASGCSGGRARYVPVAPADGDGDADGDTGGDADAPVDGDAGEEPLGVRIARALEFAEEQLESAVAEVGDPSRYPSTAEEGAAWETTGPAGWTSGFFPGCLWLMHEHTGRVDFREWAEAWTEGLEGRQHDTTTHDVGFQILSSYGQGHRIAGVDGYDGVILTAAASLDTRWSETIGCTRSWDWGDWIWPVIVDNMMNLELLFWGAANGGESSWADHALSHALRTRVEHVRADDTTYHVVEFDVDTGDVLWRGHHQGYDDESTWARGMAWAIYGFTMAYREDESSELLETAERLASWFLDHLPEDNVPYWDFEDPSIPDAPRDTSAAAVVASALLELESLVEEPAAQTRYHGAAEQILGSLCSRGYLTRGTGSSAILRHAYYHRPRSTIVADYYFLEALLRHELGIR